MHNRRGIIIIPARGGSKGIKNKNIVLVEKKPLIYYTIALSLKAIKNGLVEKAIVSTDSPKIAEISKKLGAEVPFLRPKKISGDKSKSIDLVLHALDFYQKKSIKYDYVVLLQPTSPLRSYGDVKGSINLFLKLNCDSLISVFRVEKNIDIKLYYKKNKTGIPVSLHHNDGKGRQDLKELFMRNASVYITSEGYLRKTKKIISDKPVLFVTPEYRSFDIDTKKDLTAVRKAFRKKKKSIF